MKKNIFFILIYSMILSFLLADASFAARKSIHSTDSYSSQPFQDQWQSLPPNYNGHDITAVYRILSERSSIKKDESTAHDRLEQGTGREQNKTIIGNMTVGDRVAFVLQQPEKKYDSKNSKFVFEIKHMKSDGILVRKMRVVDGQPRKYAEEKPIQSGKRKKGELGVESMPLEEEGDVLFRVVISDGDRQSVMRVAVDMPPAEARRANDNMRVMLICDLTDHHVRKAMSDGSVSRYSNILKADLKKVMIFNHQSGKIYRKVDPIFHEEIAELNKAVKRDPGYAASYDTQGNVYYRPVKQDQTLAQYTRTIEQNSNSANAYYNRGNVYFKLGRHPEAIADYSKAIELYSNYAMAYNNRGSACVALGKYHEAMADYHKVIELNPKDAVAYNNAGNVYSALGKHHESVAQYNKAIKLNPKYVIAYNNRGSAYVDLGKYNEAMADYNKAIELNPGDAIAYHNRGNVYSRLGKHQDAIADYNTAINLNPKYAVAYHNRGSAYDDLRKYDDAVADYNKAIELNPGDAIAYHNRGNAYYYLGKYQEAISDYNKATELDPTIRSAYNNRGAAYYALGKYKQAIVDLSKAIELEPQYASPYYRRARLYSMMRNVKGALLDLTTAIQMKSSYKNDAKSEIDFDNIRHTPEFRRLTEQ
jgi:tetratricopeptide (TPR) repeat protein